MQYILNEEEYGEYLEWKAGSKTSAKVDSVLQKELLQLARAAEFRVQPGGFDRDPYERSYTVAMRVHLNDIGENIRKLLAIDTVVASRG